MGRLIGGGLIGKGGAALFDLTIWIKNSSAPSGGKSAQVYYKIGVGGSWTLAGGTTSTTCVDITTINNIPAGSSVYICVEDSSDNGGAGFNAVDNDLTCPATSTVYIENRASDCGVPFITTVNATKNVALTVTVTGGNFSKACV